ncbi:hypothetical protein EK0264_01610 [Epidermidibacterium keratini]|uniref:Uncharacterized protein n=1 Tax=Epidermidibacterium keratini TaxID=1891644 RepID=A0A7L4YJP0_9ACTN|nr:hypothetical protein [Epidermidibacterium keratini]QHB99112.1 hypothetical protein EK0264_01610 [Epidermidibacterium keratini]
MGTCAFPPPKRPDSALWVAGAGFIVAAVSALVGILTLLASVVLEIPGLGLFPWIFAPLCFFASYATGVGSLRIIDGQGGLALLRVGCIAALAAIWLEAARSAYADPEDGQILRWTALLPSVFLLLVLLQSRNRKLVRWLAGR